MRVAWLVADTTVNLLHSMDSSVLVSMQGALGFKRYVPSSTELQNFTLRWRRKFYIDIPDAEVSELDAFGILAYDLGSSKAAEKLKLTGDYSENVDHDSSS